jgi:dihydroorotase-like cyclic amidohydrolase
MARTVFRNGRVYDGGLEAARPADVVVAGNRISAVAAGIQPQPDDHVIDASGCVIMPGLVETPRRAPLARPPPRRASS